MADEAVRLSQKICKRQPGVGLWIDQLTSRLRTRAEIRQAIGHHRAAMADAHEAITAHEAGGNPRYSLLVPDLHILLAELHAALGEREPALRHSEAIEQFRQALQSGDENTHLITARTLSRYAAIMLLLGDHERAESAARARRGSASRYCDRASPRSAGSPTSSSSAAWCITSRRTPIRWTPRPRRS